MAPYTIPYLRLIRSSSSRLFIMYGRKILCLNGPYSTVYGRIVRPGKLLGYPILLLVDKIECKLIQMLLLYHYSYWTKKNKRKPHKGFILIFNLHNLILVYMWSRLSKYPNRIYLHEVDNIPIEEAVYIINVWYGKFCDTLKEVSYVSFSSITPR
jgi:hypothetical protein